MALVTLVPYLLLLPFGYLTKNVQQKTHAPLPRKLLPLLFCLVAGISVQTYTNLSFFYTALLFAPLSFLWLFPNFFCRTLVCFFSIGFLASATQLEIYQAIQQEIPHTEGCALKKISLQARVLAKKHNSITLAPTDFSGKIFWYGNKRYAKNLFPGDCIELTNINLRTAHPTGFARYLVKENALATLFSRKKPKLIQRPRFSLARRFFQTRQKLYQTLKQKLSSKSFSYFASIFLGNKEPLSQGSQERTPFYYWGIAHYLARSGLHIALFILLWRLLLSLLPIFFLAKHVLLITFCLVYALLSWPSISFFRALTLFLTYELGIITNHKPHIFYLLYLITGTILIFNPTQLFFLDFQLSFALTLALTAIYAK